MVFFGFGFALGFLWVFDFVLLGTCCLGFGVITLVGFGFVCYDLWAIYCWVCIAGLLTFGCGVVLCAGEFTGSVGVFGVGVWCLQVDFV